MGFLSVVSARFSKFIKITVRGEAAMYKRLMGSKKLFVLSCVYVSVMHTAVAGHNSDVETLGDVVVSATKTEQSSSDAPASVSVVSAKNIDNMNIHSPD